MDCCVINHDDYDQPEFYTEEMPRARIPYKCGDVIPAGDHYERVTGLWDGSFDTHKTCSACVAIKEKFCCGYFFGFVIEELRDYIKDYGDFSVSDLDSLPPYARAKMINIIDDEAET